ncbi:MAG TPA: hypothetical protein VLJ88_11250 [Propionibacteriaceae bacterium]|nr:hypothetical protein [Propionibacteriaceae bacterium]
MLAAVAMLVVSGCHQPAPPTPPVEGLAWTRITLAEGTAPSALAPLGDRLLVGGQSSADGDHPVLFQLDATGAVRPVPLRPNSPYAKVADLSSLASNGTQVFALGEAHGGAHSNFRWTAWSGSAHALTEHPQTFETFGGISAGSLLDIVATTDGPVIAGSWSAADGRGLDGAIWLPRGQTWQRQESAGGALANRDEQQVAPRAASAHGSTMTITGSVITFHDGVQQSAAIWTWPSRDAAWQLSRLPEPGGRSEALSSACAEQCWVAGYVDGQVALWRTGPGDPVRESALPVAAIDVDGPGPRMVIVGGRPGVLFSHAETSRLLLEDGSGWRTLTAPDGRVRDAVLIGNRLYAIVGTDLWSTELA